MANEDEAKNTDIAEITDGTNSSAPNRASTKNTGSSSAGPPNNSGAVCNAVGSRDCPQRRAGTYCGNGGTAVGTDGATLRLHEAATTVAPRAAARGTRSSAREGHLAQTLARGNDGRRVQQAGQEHSAVPRAGPEGRPDVHKKIQHAWAFLPEARTSVGRQTRHDRRVRDGPGGVAASPGAADDSGARASHTGRRRESTGLTDRPASERGEALPR